jgi:hypothetical protein
VMHGQTFYLALKTSFLIGKRRLAAATLMSKQPSAQVKISKFNVCVRRLIIL